jgi:hypothetical protein
MQNLWLIPIVVFLLMVLWVLFCDRMGWIKGDGDEANPVDQDDDDESAGQ